MQKIPVYNQQGEKVADRPLNERVFGVAVNPGMIHQVIVALQAQARPVLADTKDRGEVRGGGKKPWKQKGTGRARHGSTRSPIWRGGGITFGPTSDRNFTLKINKKVKQKALLMALSDKATDGLVAIDLLELAGIKTKTVNTILQKLSLRPAPKKAKQANPPSQRVASVLIVVPGKNEVVTKSARNIAKVKIVTAKNLSVLDIIGHRYVLISVPALDTLEETLIK